MKNLLDSMGVVKYINVLFTLLAIFLIIMVAYRAVTQSALIKKEKYNEIEVFAK